MRPLDGSVGAGGDAGDDVLVAGAQDPAELGAYMGWTLPYYAEHFLEWWRGRLRPEMERNFVRFDEFDYDQASLVELAILLEDAIDMHDRHWQIHWVLNFAQFSSTLALNAAVTAAKGEGDHGALMGRLQSSTENRNWDSIEELWKIKEWIKAEQGLGLRETPLHLSICSRAILQPGALVVPDLTGDTRFSSNPLVTGPPYVRFYAGAVLLTPDGLPLGTL